MSDERLILSSVAPGGPVHGLAVVDVDGEPLVVCTGFYKLWTWAPLRDEWLERPLTSAFAAEHPDAENDIDSVAVAVSDGRVVLAAGGDEQGVSVWDLFSGELLRGNTYNGPYIASIATVKDEEPPLFAASSGIHWDGVQLWGLGEEPPIELEAGSVWGLATARIDGRSLVAGGGEEGVTVWDAANGEEVASFYVDDEQRSYAVSFSEVDGRPVVVAGTDAGKVYVFDLAASEDDDPIHEPATGHEGGINALDTAMVGDRPVAVTGGEDGTVRIWYLAGGRPVGPPLTGHDARVEAVAVTTLRDRPVALTAGRDGTVRVWDLAL
ncbi:WD40 repeat domain-containing protein [Streptomyces sp. NPDC020845]|uniref:WD40 repeat domain-containing protein n=1 Tax=Streptomyces sp. NPDC020845 TaxID=3365096 RepID=UPI0037A93F40